MLVRERDLADGSTTRPPPCAAALADTGAIAVREDIELEPAFWGQFPGNEAYPRPPRADLDAPTSPASAACTTSRSARPSGNHWGEAVTLLETTSATPFFFNFHHGDLGNFTVIGPSGSGKTVVLNFLPRRRGSSRPRTIFFDKDRGAELFIRGIGGRYDRIRAGRADRASTRSRCPTRRPTARSCATGWACCSRPNGPEELATIAGAVDAAYANDAVAAPPAPFPRAAAAARAGRSRATSPPARAVDRAAASAPGCSTTPTDKLDLSARVLGFDMTALLETRGCARRR